MSAEAGRCPSCGSSHPLFPGFQCSHLWHITAPNPDFAKAASSAPLPPPLPMPEFTMPACHKHFFKGHHPRCKACDSETESQFRDVCNAWWAVGRVVPGLRRGAAR